MKSKLLSILAILLVSILAIYIFNYSSVQAEPLIISPVNHLIYESNTGDSIIMYQGYCIIYSFKYNLPIYAFHHLSPDQLKIIPGRTPARRINNFYPVSLPNGALSATNNDYKKSGYDRGHMVPAGDFVWNQDLKNETFFYTNINPQNSRLNRGIWANLEDRIRAKVLETSMVANIVTGVILDEQCTQKIGPRDLCVPSSFFKIVYFDQTQRMYCFLFDNHIEQFYGQITDFQVTADFLEEITGEDFFDILNDELEGKIESQITNFDERYQ